MAARVLLTPSYDALPATLAKSWTRVSVLSMRTDEDWPTLLVSITQERTITNAVGSRSLRHQEGLGLPTRRILARRMVLEAKEVCNETISTLDLGSS